MYARDGLITVAVFNAELTTTLESGKSVYDCAMLITAFVTSSCFLFALNLPLTKRLVWLNLSSTPHKTEWSPQMKFSSPHRNPDLKLIGDNAFGIIAPSS